MDLRPWMIETSYEFIKGSRLLWSNRLNAAAMTSAGIGLEVLFKSFNAIVAGPHGGIGEQYEVLGARNHDLLLLFDAIPKPIIERLGFQTFRDFFKGKIRKLFVLSRYPYEKEALAGSSSVIIEIAEQMLDRIISEYKACECSDPWILAYPNV